jgi:hypothetical protein
MMAIFSMSINGMRSLRKLSACCLLYALSCLSVFAQVDSTKNQSGYIDGKDLRMLIRGRLSDKLGSGIPVSGKLMLFVVPIIGSNPSLGTFFGIGGTGAIYLGSPETTSVSNMNASVLYTTKDQLVTTLRGTIMTRDNSWEMLVDLKYASFSENTFGLGSDENQPVKDSWNMDGIQTAGVSGAQPMTFNQLKIHFTALKNLGRQIYAGIGYHLDYHYNIQDLDLDLGVPEPVITSHYGYSVFYDIDPEKYISTGTSLNLVYDSRDHTVNPYRGKFLRASYRADMGFLGSERSNQQLYLETRLYYPLSKKIPRHLLGFWIIGHFTIEGEVPYLHLPASSYDMRNRIGRGYVAGRFRGPSWITAETEYRFSVTRNGLIGGVIFGSITSTSSNEIIFGTESLDKLGLFEAIRPAGGFGARVMLNRSGRLNLGMDLAFGQDGAKGFYFNVGETF